MRQRTPSTTMMNAKVTLAAAVCLLATCCYGNQFDPHLFPLKGPFFEGWYVRLIDDVDPQTSIGFLFGSVLPESSAVSVPSKKVSGSIRKNIRQNTWDEREKQQRKVVTRFHIDGESKNDFYQGKQSLHHQSTEKQHGYDSEDNFHAYNHEDKFYQYNHKDKLNGDKYPLVIASILLQDRQTSQQLQAFTGNFPVTSYSLKVRGEPVSQNPDDKSPADFSAQFGTNGSFVVKSDGSVTVNVTIGNLNLFIQGSNPKPWGVDGEGPEGWLEHLPLPLHWFVYSLGSEVSAYKLADLSTGRELSGSSAHLHMEKNWGSSFPPAWVWVQGRTSSGIVLALSGGVVDFDKIGLNVTAFLIGYRNPGKGIVFNFTPANSVTSFHHDGCVGVVNLNVTSLTHRLVIKAATLPNYFSDCILGPERKGFRSACVESYGGVATVTAYKRDDFHFVAIDSVDMQNVAVEFGGDYVCQHKCSM